ncbi:zinc-dependent alcohol dehydrogenase family protein [Sorangium sp. So ce726]|uniref:zinc-dependent alcohol dehydrogenase family protein n=1 Tax=Sorangium sp. So ce726 TaxID=3133319 RepID=UPI003F5E98FD
MANHQKHAPDDHLNFNRPVATKPAGMDDTVKIVRFHAEGGPEVLCLEDVERPDPGPGEVRLKVRAIGLNRADAFFRQGSYLFKARLPSVLGSEAAGEIDALGPDVHGFSIGDRVSVIPLFPIDRYSLYGESSLAPAHALSRVPDDVDWPEAAASWTAYSTAWGALIGLAKLQAGQTVLISAASSSCGLAAIQIAGAVGARPIALTRRSSKRDALLRAGAVQVIATEEEELASAVLRATEDRGADLTFDPVGGPGFPKLVAATAQRGLIVVYGELAHEITPLPIYQVLARELTIKGYANPLFMQDGAVLAAMKSWVYERMASGKLRPIIDRTFPLGEIVEAHRYLESNTQVGKVVVLP